MAETHLLQHVAMLVLLMWWTKHWLMDPIIARWRFVVAAIAGIIGWIYVAFSATRVVDPSGGVGHVFGSPALAYFAAFMAIVSAAGLLLGLLLWTEENVDAATPGDGVEMPAGLRRRLGD